MAGNLTEDEMLVQYMTKAEEVMLEQIPPESELSHRFSRHFQRKMKALLRHEKRSIPMRKMVSGMRHLAAAVLIVLGIGLVVTMSVEAYREKLFQFIIEIYPELTSIRTVGDGGTNNEVLVPVEPGYVPEGYYLDERSVGSLTVLELYVNDAKQNICYSQSLLGCGEMILDTEDADVSTVVVEGIDLMLVEKESVFNMVYWHDEKNQYSLDGNIEMDELIKMAKSMIEKNK